MSPLPQNLSRALEERFGAVREVRSVSGGDTSEAVSLRTERAGRLFVKYGAGAAGSTYAAEAAGLAALAEAVTAAGETERIYVPEPLAASAPTADGPGYLVLPWLDGGAATQTAWTRFGESLAAVHRASPQQEGYGWPRDNFLGPETQVNARSESWVDFYRERRLRAMADRMRARDRWLAKWDEPFDALALNLGEWLPADPPPALLHGDLWGGNAVALADGRFALIDPAVYVGHHEVDLALTELFGGFAPGFRGGYRSVVPEVPGYPERRDLYQLYYLIMHLGISMGYGARVEATLRRYGAS